MYQCCQLQRQLRERLEYQRIVSSYSETTTIRTTRSDTFLQSRSPLRRPQAAHLYASRHGLVHSLSTHQAQRDPRKVSRCRTGTLSRIFSRRALAREATLLGTVVSTERVTMFWVSCPSATYMVSSSRHIPKAPFPPRLC